MLCNKEPVILILITEPRANTLREEKIRQETMKKQKRRKKPMLDHEEADCWKELRQEKDIKNEDDKTGLREEG